MIKISVNNELIELKDSLTLSKYLKSYSDKQEFAVAINGDFVPRSQYINTQLNNGDQLDIVAPVGGG